MVSTDNRFAPFFVFLVYFSNVFINFKWHRRSRCGTSTAHCMERQTLPSTQGGDAAKELAMDFAELERKANQWANTELDCSIVLDRMDDDKAVFKMMDDDGEEISEATVRQVGSVVVDGVPVEMVAMDDGSGSVFCENRAEMLARLLYC